MVKIRLKRLGRKNDMTYRIVVSDSRNTPRGQNIEEIGSFDPIDNTDNNRLKINEESALKWLSLGAQPSESVRTLFKKTGIWAKFVATKKGAQKVEKVSRENNKTSGKAKQAAKSNKAKLEEARIARHKAKRLAKRQDKQPVENTEEAAA